MGDIKRIWRLDKETERFRELYETLAERIAERGRPERICTIQRGGAIIARYVADLLGYPEIYSEGARSYGGGLGESGEIKIYQDIPPLTLTEDRVYIDDVFDTGKSIARLEKKLNDTIYPSTRELFGSAGDHFFAALLAKSEGIKRLSGMKERIMYIEGCDDDTWVVFPGEAHETIEKLIASISNPATSDDRMKMFVLLRNMFERSEVENAVKYRGIKERYPHLITEDNYIIDI